MEQLNAQALTPGVDLLKKSGIGFGKNKTGYEYKKWIPAVLPFIQASTNIWPFVQDGWNNNIEHLPFFQRIQAGRAYDFQIFTPREHPFLLIDVKISATFHDIEGDDPPITSVGSRFRAPGFSLATQTFLWKKYLMAAAEQVESTLIAVSPGGRQIWGGLQNVTGLDNSVRTVGTVPHIERVPVVNSQCNRSGSGALKHHLLFPEDGIIRVTVENRRAVPADPVNESAIDVNGVCFGYVIQL